MNAVITKKEEAKERRRLKKLPIYKEIISLYPELDGVLFVRRATAVRRLGLTHNSQIDRMIKNGDLRAVDTASGVLVFVFDLLFQIGNKIKRRGIKVDWPRTTPGKIGQKIVEARASLGYHKQDDFLKFLNKHIEISQSRLSEAENGRSFQSQDRIIEVLIEECGVDENYFLIEDE